MRREAQVAPCPGKHWQCPPALFTRGILQVPFLFHSHHRFSFMQREGKLFLSSPSPRTELAGAEPTSSTRCWQQVRLPSRPRSVVGSPLPPAAPSPRLSPALLGGSLLPRSQESKAQRLPGWALVCSAALLLQYITRALS